MKSFSLSHNTSKKNQIEKKCANFPMKRAEIRTYTSDSLPSLFNEADKEKFAGKKGVFFDANGVLYHRRANKIITLQNFLISKGFDKTKFPEEQVVYDKLYDLKSKAGKGEASKEYFYTQLFKLHDVNDPSLLKEGVDEMKNSISRIIVNEGVAHTLSSLKLNGFKLGVITNSMSSRLEKLQWLKNVGITTSWDGFVSSKDVGVKKPHPDIYLKCLDEAKVNPNEAIFVGHSLSELIGAKKLGITTCMVNPDVDARADFNLRNNLSNILSYIH